MDRNLKKDEDSESSEGQNAPGIPRPGKQVDQGQQEFAPPQPASRGLYSSGNPDLDPPSLSAQSHRIDLREPNPLTPDGMLFDPRRLLETQRRRPEFDLPPGARFDPYGPPDPSEVFPGRGPGPSTGTFGNPDPDHFHPPGVDPAKILPQPGKALKKPWPPGSGGQPHD